MSFKRYVTPCFSLLLINLVSPFAWAAADTHSGPYCDPGEISVHCGRAPSTVWHQGRLWVVFAQNEYVYVVDATGANQSYSAPVAVNDTPEIIETNGENRPKIAVTDKAIVVSWTQKTEGHFSGDIRFSRSLDGGRTFEKPRTINDDGQLTSHRFDSLLTTADGIVYVAWLDKRNKLKAQDKGKLYPGSALYYAVSNDHGQTFSRNFAVADNSCECCRIGVAPAGKNNLALFWRHIYASTDTMNTRDHGFAIVSPTGETLSRERATVDDWQIDACPHHGPDIAPAYDAGYHLAWFTDGRRRSGIYYGFYDATKATTQRISAMDTSAGASHPQVMQANGRVYFVWKLFDGEQTQIRMATSNDAGETWSEPQIVATTQGASDHPLLSASKDKMYLSWHTRDEGFRIVAIDNEGRSTTDEKI